MAHPEKAKTRTTGHLGPIIDPDLKCRNKICSCRSENLEVRQKRAQGGFNTNPFRCSWGKLLARAPSVCCQTAGRGF